MIEMLAAAFIIAFVAVAILDHVLLVSALLPQRQWFGERCPHTRLADPA